MSLKSIGGVALKLAGGFGGPLGSVATAASLFQKSPVRTGGTGASISFNNPFRNPSGIIGWLTGRGGKGGRHSPENGTCGRGYHLNKHKLADGTPARTVCVRNRSMNALNGRAAMRAVRRVKRAEKLVRKLHIFKPVHRLASRPACGCIGKHTCK